MHENEDDLNLRRHLVRSLRHHRSMRFLFSERSTEMTLRSGVWQYGIADGLPGDILKFNALTLRTSLDSTQWIPISTMVSVKEMRELHSSTNSTGYPEYWCYFAQQVWFYPTPSGAYILNLDIQSDFTRDQETGAQIAEDSDEATNIFIREAEEALVARAGYTYALTIQGDANKAQLFSAAHVQAVAHLKKERDLMKLDGAQMRAHGF